MPHLYAIMGEVCPSTESAKMVIELPKDTNELLSEIARDSLARMFKTTFGLDLPDYIANSRREIKRAAQEWSSNYASQIILLSNAARQALEDLDRVDLTAAIMGFTSKIITQPDLDNFMHLNPYLEELVADTCDDPDLFRKLLTLFANLQTPTR